MAEDTLSNEERASILNQVFVPKTRETPRLCAQNEQATDLSTESFGSLLEKSLNIRANMDKADHKEEDEIREKVIKTSRLDLIEKFLGRI